jgi:DNA-binding PadR family transcriptional regulator
MKAELLILGVLHRGNLHPYEIKRRLTNAMVECFTDVDVGTLYYAVRQLAQHGLIQPTSQQRVLRGGVRTVYRITARGRERFQRLLHERFAADGSVADTLYVAMLFLHFCDRQRIAELLRGKIARQKDAIGKLAGIKKRFKPVLSTGGSQLLKHLEAQRKLDLKWLQGLLADVAAGRVRDVPNAARLQARGWRLPAR